MSKSGAWVDQQDFTAGLFKDGWGTPNTYCNQFRPLITGPAVYMLLLVNTETYREAMVAYVGMSEKLKQRISGHNILPELDRPGYWAMVWFKPTPKQELRDAEASLILAYDPPWNIQGRRRGMVLQ